MKAKDEYIIDQEFQGARLDRFLRKSFPGLSLATLQKLLRKKVIRLNGKKASGNARLATGDKVTCPAAVCGISHDDREYPETAFPKNDIHIMYENEDIIIVDKKHGIPVHKGSRHPVGLTELLRGSRKNNLISPVNRIDRRTGGLVAFGKSRKALREYSALVRSGDVDKRYYVLVKGAPEQEMFFMRNTLVRTDKGMVTDDRGKEARAEVRLVKNGKLCSLLEVFLDTGRTHQIRVQLAEMGLPVIGDGRYGVYEEGPMYLYSHYICFHYKGIEVEAGMPEMFLKRLRADQ